MRKLIFSGLLVSTFFLPHAVMAAQHTVTLGYAQSEVKNIKEINGVNVKYRYEWDAPLSIISSFSYMSGGGSNSYYLVKDRFKNDVDVKYYSFLAGPAWRINDYISLYGLLGLNYNKVGYKSAWYNYEGYNSDGDKYVYMGTENNKRNKSSIAYSVGFQVNPVENIAIDIAYEGSRFNDEYKHYSINGFNIGVGYRF